MSMQTRAIPTKAISPARDRSQSRALVAVIVPLLAFFALRNLVPPDPLAPRTLFVSAAASAVFALLAWSLKAATPAAALCGGLICLLLTEARDPSARTLVHSGLPPLIALFALTFTATRFGRSRKEARGLAEARTGRRASQIIANLGTAAICAALSRWHPFAFVAAIAALAEATADTLSSEIGQAIGGTPLMLTTLRPVSPGTDGAITLAGTFGGLGGAALLIVVALAPSSFEPRLFVALFSSATAGLFFDSLLGATIERRGSIGNDLVNFASTAFAAAIVYPIGLALHC